MKKSLSALLAGIMALSLAACSGGSTAPEGGGSSDTPATAAAGDDERSMIVAIASQFDTLDPCLSTTVYNGYVISHIYSGLMRTNTEGQPEPDLCTGFDISDDGLTYTFHLRDDVTFSDGTPITSANYEYAWLRAMSYGIDAATRTNDMVTYIKGGTEYNLHAIEVGDSFDCTTEDHSSVGINCIDDYTIEVTLSNPLAYFPQWLGAGVWSALPLDTPQHDNAWSLEPGYATSGPYVLDYININDKAEISRNEKYCDPDFVKLDKETVAAILGVPAFVLGVGEYSKDEWNAFIQSTVMVICKSIAAELTKKLIIKPEWYLQFNVWSLMDYDLKTVSDVLLSGSDRGYVNGDEWRDRMHMSPAGLTEYKILENYLPYDMSGKQKKLIQE